MKKYIQLFLGNELIKGSALVFVGSVVTNGLNYLFHFITGRLLGPEQYAVVASLISLMFVISFPSAILSTLVVRKIAYLHARNNMPEIRGLFRMFLSYITVFLLITSTLFFIFQQQVADFLRIQDPFMIWLLGLIFAFSLLNTFQLAVLQGMLKFVSFSVLTALTALVKDVSALIAIFLGMGVFGVVWGMVITVIIICFFSFIPLLHLLKGTVKHTMITSSRISAALWIAPPLVGMSLMLNGDVMLVKHFFPAYEAGLYGGLATMGKVVLFISTSITTVLLPLAIKRKEEGKNVSSMLILSLAVSGILSGGVVLAYFLLPDLAITLLYGPRYLAVNRYLGLYGMYFLFYNLAYVFIYYYISLHRRYVLFIPLVCAMIQLILIFMFHQTIMYVIIDLIASSALLFGLYLLYYLVYEQKILPVPFRHRARI